MPPSWFVSKTCVFFTECVVPMMSSPFGGPNPGNWMGISSFSRLDVCGGGVRCVIGSGTRCGM